MPALTIKIESTVHRIALAAALLACIAAAFYAARWSFGNAISVHADYKEVAALAVDMAPADPQTHYSLAVLTEKTFLPDELAVALSEYEKAVAYAPDDYRVWLALGKARERVGDSAGAELAIRRSMELAPAYSQVHWTLGNVLLRKGETSGAFAEIRMAAERDRQYVEPAVATAWQMLDGDLTAMRSNLGAGIDVNFALAVYLAKRKRFDDALAVWAGLPPEVKRGEFHETGKALVGEMLAVGNYADALAVQNQIAPTDADALRIGEFSNPGFESAIDIGGGFFEWRIGDGLRPQIGIDNAVRYGGSQSLVLVFDSGNNVDFRSISQTIAVDPGRNYRFAAFYKSDLKTSATFRWEIADTADGLVLASTGAIAANSDWAEISAEFKTQDTTGAVIVRLVREKCGPVCPITGRVWFDDFSLGQ